MRQSCQVLVVGAGPSGALAAIAAARSGADTVLVEQDAAPGGLGRSQFHRHLCGWYLGGTEEPGPILHGPLVQEAGERLRRAVPSARPLRMGRTWVWPLEDGAWSPMLATWLRETSGVRLLLRQRVTAFDPAEDSAGLVRTRGDAGEIDVSAGVLVDASGRAAVATLAAWDTEEEADGERQLAACTLRVAGVEIDGLLPFRVPDCLRRSAEAGRLPAAVRYTTFIPADDGAASLLRLNLPADTPPWQVAQLGHAVLAELRESCPSFKGAVLQEASALMPRDGPRLRGRYRLSGDDVVGAQRFPDAVARGAWPCERWSQSGGPRYRYPPDGTSYDIPLRALLSPRSERVLFPGRSLSADPDGAASVRVMGIAMATGEAAGREAARRAG